MATNKPRASSKPKQLTQNTSAAPVPGNSAVQGIPSGVAEHNVSATEAAQAASHANSPDAGQPSREEPGNIPPVGGKKSGEPVATALIVSSKVEGFRRAGRPWSREAQTVSIDEFSLEQIEALLAEQMLAVTVVAK